LLVSAKAFSAFFALANADLFDFSALTLAQSRHQKLSEKR
jgi:hypothetical protein